MTGSDPTNSSDRKSRVSGRSCAPEYFEKSISDIKKSYEISTVYKKITQSQI